MHANCALFLSFLYSMRHLKRQRHPSQRATNANDDQIQAPPGCRQRHNEDNPPVAPPRDLPVHQAADLSVDVLQQIVATVTEQVTQRLAPIINPPERNKASQVIAQVVPPSI